jgi:hypothetical protein
MSNPARGGDAVMSPKGTHAGFEVISPAQMGFSENRVRPACLGTRRTDASSPDLRRGGATPSRRARGVGCGEKSVCAGYSSRAVAERCDARSGEHGDERRRLFIKAKTLGDADARNPL